MKKLKDVSFDSENVMVVHLMSGEHLIGLVDKDSPESVNGVVANFVLTVNFVQANNTLKVHTHPFSPVIDIEEPMFISNKIIAMKYKPHAEFLNEYKQGFMKMTSGLILPEGIQHP